MLKSLPTLLVVTAVTLAIWMVAEAESVRSEPVDIVVAIDPVGTNGRIARPEPGMPWSGKVTLTLEGSAAALDALRRTIPPTIILAPGNGLRLEAGSYEQDVREALSGLEPFASANLVTIRQVEPPAVAVEIAEQDSLEVPVELATGGSAIDGTFVIDPPRVTINGPRDVIRRLTSASRATIRLSQSDLARLVPGREETLTDVRVTPPSEVTQQELWGGTPISPPTVRVRITLRAQSDSFTLPNMPVLLLLAPVELNDWVVEVGESDKFLQSVEFTGPRDMIDQIKRGEWRVDAVVRLTFADLQPAVATGTLTREAVIGPLPPGVSFRCDDRQVVMTVRRREGAGTSQPASPNDNND